MLVGFRIWLHLLCWLFVVISSFRLCGLLCIVVCWLPLVLRVFVLWLAGLFCLVVVAVGFAGGLLQCFCWCLRFGGCYLLVIWFYVWLVLFVIWLFVLFVFMQVWCDLCCLMFILWNGCVVTVGFSIIWFVGFVCSALCLLDSWFVLAWVFRFYCMFVLRLRIWLIAGECWFGLLCLWLIVLGWLCACICMMTTCPAYCFLGLLHCFSLLFLLFCLWFCWFVCCMWVCGCWLFVSIDFCYVGFWWCVIAVTSWLLWELVAWFTLGVVICLWLPVDLCLLLLVLVYDCLFIWYN